MPVWNCVHGPVGQLAHSHILHELDNATQKLPRLAVVCNSISIYEYRSVSNNYIVFGFDRNYTVITYQYTVQNVVMDRKLRLRQKIKARQSLLNATVASH